MLPEIGLTKLPIFFRTHGIKQYLKSGELFAFMLMIYFSVVMIVLSEAL